MILCDRWDHEGRCTKNSTVQVKVRIRDSYGLEMDVPMHRCDEHYRELQGVLTEHDYVVAYTTEREGE